MHSQTRPRYQWSPHLRNTLVQSRKKGPYSFDSDSFLQKRKPHKLPRNLINSHASQNVFIKQTSNERVELVHSSHVGHQFVKSLAALNRKKFQDGVKTDDTGSTTNRVALAVLNSIKDKGRGKIYLQDNGALEWREVVEQAEARDLVIRILMSIYGLKDSTSIATSTGKNTMPHSQKRPRDENYSIPRSSMPLKKRVRFSMTGPDAVRSPPSPIRRVSKNSFTAAETLALMSSLRSNPAPVVSTSQSVNSVVDSSGTSSTLAAENSASFGPSVALKNAQARFGNRVQNSPPHATISHRENSHGTTRTDGDIAMADLRPSDVILGGPGVGALNSPNSGNRRFRALLKSQVGRFAQLDNDRQGMVQMARTAVSSVEGRFVLLENGWLRETTTSKALSGTLRTYQELLRHRLHEKSLAELRVASRVQQQQLQMASP